VEEVSVRGRGGQVALLWGVDWEICKLCLWQNPGFGESVSYRGGVWSRENPKKQSKVHARRSGCNDERQLKGNGDAGTGGAARCREGGRNRS